MENLPSWASQETPRSDKLSVIINVNSKAAYDEWLEKLGNPHVDQYWMEVAYQCIKLDCQMALVGSEFDPRTCGKPAEIRFARCDEYRLSNLEPGRGVEASTGGREARDHYVRLRGRMPF